MPLATRWRRSARVMDRGCTTRGSAMVNVPALVAVPEGVTTAMGPVVAPEGTTAVTCVDELTTKLADVPSNATVEVD